jgi:hypothetical protein
MHLHSSPNQRLFFLAANQVAEPRRASAMLKSTPVKGPSDEDEPVAGG